jgi:hypothetical protein
MRRLAAAVAAVTLGLTLAPAARAQLASTQVEFLFGPAGTLDDRSWSPQPGSVVTGRWQVRVHATSSGSLERLQVRLESEEEGLAPAGQGPPPRLYSLLSGAREDELSFEWDTAAVTPLNGRYRWVAEASSYLGSSSTAVLDGLKVNNPPEPPGPVSVRLDGSTPVVSWAAATEQDVVGWRIWRAPSGTDSFEPAGTVQSQEFRDEGAPPGAQTYEVNAVRRSPVTAGGIPSQLSARTQAVQVPGAVPPPPAAPAPSLPPVRGKPQSAGTFRPDLPYVTPPSSAPASPSPAVSPSAAVLPSQVTAARVPHSTTADRLRFWAAGAVLLAAGVGAWRVRRKVLTGR